MRGNPALILGVGGFKGHKMEGVGYVLGAISSTPLSGPPRRNSIEIPAGKVAFMQISNEP